MSMAASKIFAKIAAGSGRRLGSWIAGSSWRRTASLF
jgi:hypothetical protein